MRERTALAIATAVALGAIPAHAAVTTAFDGNWNFSYICANSHDSSKGFTWNMLAQIHDGLLVAQHGQKGAPASATVTGKIDAEGEGLLRFEGITGPSDYSLHRVAPSTPYHYTADVHFSATRGPGSATRTGTAR